MPYCKNCGSELSKRDTSCFECGEPTDFKKQNPVVACPRCESTSIGFVSETTGSDYDVSSGCCGYILLGPLGLLCGLSNGSKKTVTKRKCNHCGHEF